MTDALVLHLTEKPETTDDLLLRHSEKAETTDVLLLHFEKVETTNDLLLRHSETAETTDDLLLHSFEKNRPRQTGFVVHPSIVTEDSETTHAITMMP
jgi:hypothetical protein